MPVLMMSLTLVHEVPKDGCASAEPGHLPAEGHGLAITPQERHPVRGGGDGCKEAQRESVRLSGAPLSSHQAAVRCQAGVALGTGPTLPFLADLYPSLVFMPFLKEDKKILCIFMAISKYISQ